MKIIYIPLDERPCNLLYPGMMAEVRSDLTLITPEASLLGNKKQAADVASVFGFIEQHIQNADALVFSVEMLLYGGLLPSRLHHDSQQQLMARLQRIKQLKSRFPAVRFYAFNLIMRTPRYNSSDEEPDYYQQHGEQIFRRSWLLDKQDREGLSQHEIGELQLLNDQVPTEYIQDYEQRRQSNLSVNKQVLAYRAEGVLDYLALPQDDSAEYGYTAQDQRAITQQIDALSLFGRVYLYPGADEAGATLIARAVNDRHHLEPRIYAFFSSTLGEQIVPLYEDRPMGESLKAHVAAVGGRLVDTVEQADMVLAINSPGKWMQEAWQQFEQRDITYTSYRYLPGFADRIRDYVRQGYPVMVADAAYANGGDYQLVSLLDKRGCLDGLVSYKGWNTYCNTLGTSLAQGLLTQGDCDANLIQRNVLYHVLDDLFYQSKVRMAITSHLLPQLGIDYFSLGQQGSQVMIEARTRIQQEFDTIIKHSFQHLLPVKFSFYSPWNRMFEIGTRLECQA